MIRKIRCDTAMNFKPLNARKEYYMNEYLENQLNKSVVYQQLKDNCERNNQHEVLALVAKVGTFAVERLKTVIKNMPEFTLHDDTHIFNMLTIIGKLIPQENMRKLSTPDLFMLIVSVFLHDIGMAPDEKHILAWKNQLPETEYDEELKEEREKFARFRLTYTHQLADIERLETEQTNCITETSTSISVDEDGEIDTNTSWSERFKSKASLSIHGIEVPYNLFPDYSNRMSKAVLKIPFPFSFRLDIGVNSDLNLNSARDQIIYDEKWLTFEENLYRIICRRLKDILSSSDWKILNEIIQKNNTDTFSRVANSFE